MGLKRHPPNHPPTHKQGCINMSLYLYLYQAAFTKTSWYLNEYNILNNFPIYFHINYTIKNNADQEPHFNHLQPQDMTLRGCPLVVHPILLAVPGQKRVNPGAA